MTTEEKIKVFQEFGNILSQKDPEFLEVLRKTELHNPWFIQFHIEISLQTFVQNYFNEDKLRRWMENYTIAEEKQNWVGLILAGNIPFVGMHDIISVLMSGNKTKIKLSSKDTFFFPYMFNKLCEIDKRFENRIEFVERLENFDAVIATGSNNSARYFEYYFGKYPHIIRRNRTSVAVLTGDETEEQLHDLGKDVFYYYGLGCRNVSKIYIPVTFEIEKLFRIWEDYRYVIENNKYNNNYDYNRALLLLNQTPHLANDFFMMVEEPKLFSPLTTIHYEYYNDSTDLQIKMNDIKEDLQCVVASAESNTPFGKTQFPELWDYSDHVDTMKWLEGER